MSNSEMLANRLRKRYKSLKNWAKTNDLSCFRLYDKDIPEYPLIVDLYNEVAVVWIYQRKIDETQERQEIFREDVWRQIKLGLEGVANRVVLKEQSRCFGHQQREPENSGLEDVIIVREQGLKLEVNVQSYLDTGIFLDNRLLRSRVQNMSRGKDVLNLFAYTGSFTCYAVKGGARTTTTVDLSKTYISWAQRNFDLNSFKPGNEHLFINDDCFNFMKKAGQSSIQYDLIICDPPSFSVSNNKNAQRFILENDYEQLLKKCLSLLRPAGRLIFCTNLRSFNFDSSILEEGRYVIENISAESIPLDFRNKNIHKCWIISGGL